MKRIGILCAGDAELAPYLTKTEKQPIAEAAMLKFYRGRIKGKEIIAVSSGVCKVNAAIAAQLLIDRFHADCIINSGTAGGMSKTVRIFDTIIARRTAYHDVARDILTDFHPYLPSVFFPSSPQLLDAAEKCRSQVKTPLLFGTIVTGETFVTKETQRDRINAKFEPLAVDMESAAVAHVCYANQIPFLAVRTITDTPEFSGLAHFEQNCTTAAEISAAVVFELIGWI